MAKDPSSAADAVPVVEMMQSALPPLLVTALALLDALHASVGLTRVLTTLLAALLEALAALTEALLTRAYAHERIAQLTGVVWRSVEALQDAPLSEREAAMRAWHEHANAASDAHKELKEAVAEAAQEEGEDDEGEEDGDEEEDALFVGRVARRDLALVQRSLAVLQLAAFALLQLERVLSAATLWTHVDAAAALSAECDELAAACYAPVDVAALEAHRGALHAATTALVAAALKEATLSDAQRTLVSGIESRLSAVAQHSATPL